MQLPKHDMSAIDAFLFRYGIDIGFLVSGFFGALLLVSKNSAQKISTTIASLMAGTACANYLTPVMIKFLPDSVQDGGKYAVAFVMGFLGLKGLELVIEKYFVNHEKKQAKKKTITRKKKTTSKKN